jgi:hypothetical protein
MGEKISGHLKHQVSLTFSQKLMTRPHPEPVESSTTRQEISITQAGNRILFELEERHVPPKRQLNSPD